jgi:MoaA/NifB/PqqE/SkfB family radical SAM enzyme
VSLRSPALGARVVVWRVNTACPLTCPFCAHDRRLGGSRPEVTLDAALQLAQRLSAWACDSGRPVLLSLLGGEPFVWAPLEAFARRARALPGLHLGLTTNGAALGRVESRRLLAEVFTEVTVSLDALGAAHDALRGATGLAARIDAGLSTLRREAPALYVRVNVVLMRDTVADLGPLCLHVATLGVNEITFNALGGRDRPEFHAEHALRPEDVRALRLTLPPLAEALARRGVRLAHGDAYLKRLEATAVGQACPVEDCAPGRDFLFVDEHLRAAPCSYTVAAFGVDALGPDPVSMLPETLRAARARHRDAQCDDCPSTQVFEKFGGGSVPAPVVGASTP